MLRGWLAAGLPHQQVTVIEPKPASWLIQLAEQGLQINKQPANPPSVVVVATKPQIMKQALPELQTYGNGRTLFISIAAGSPISLFEETLGVQTPIVRAMPNTPAAVGAAITALTTNSLVNKVQLDLAIKLMDTVGQTVVLNDENDMHTVTAISGSGPAYVFAMAEALTQAGRNNGLSEVISNQLAIAVIAGSGKLLEQTQESPESLREQVTSPHGTTAAGLDQLLTPETGLFDLLDKTIKAASARSKELAADCTS